MIFGTDIISIQKKRSFFLQLSNSAMTGILKRAEILCSVDIIAQVKVGKKFLDNIWMSFKKKTNFNEVI